MLILIGAIVLFKLDMFYIMDDDKNNVMIAKPISLHLS